MHSFFTIYSLYNLRFIAFIILWPAKPIMSLAAGFKIVLVNVLSNDNVHWLNNDKWNFHQLSNGLSFLKLFSQNELTDPHGLQWQQHSNGNYPLGSHIRLHCHLEMLDK